MSIDVWIPALTRNAPSNASGMRGSHEPYATRAEALRHTHWANQAPYATARRVTIYDGPLAGDSDAQDVLGKLLASDDFDDVLHCAAAKLIRAGRNVDGVRVYLKAAA